MFEALSLITVANLSVRECGPTTAPTICFLHGGGVSSWMWYPQIEALQDTYHCLIPDLPEHGRSARDPALYHRRYRTSYRSINP